MKFNLTLGVNSILSLKDEEMTLYLIIRIYGNDKLKPTNKSIPLTSLPKLLLPEFPEVSTLNTSKTWLIPVFGKSLTTLV